MVVFVGLAGGTCAGLAQTFVWSREIKDSHLKYLITGGAGFIGSHLSDRLTADGHEVVVLDDLSTGRIDNIQHLIRSGRIEFVEGSVTEEDLLLGVLESVDACVHLASIVGVSLVVDNPVDTLLSNVRGSDVVLSAAAGLRRPVLYASTSEVYGKHSNGALDEDADRILGPIQKCRWNYATSKSFGEALALGYAQELGAKNTVVRLFNTVGPRQTGMYGMVLPRFVRQAVTGQPLTVFGDGTQTRCFAHVHDTVDALVRLLDCEEAPGRVFNIGNDAEISIIGPRAPRHRPLALGFGRSLRPLLRGLRRGLRGAGPPEAGHEPCEPAHRLGPRAQRR